MLKSIGVLTVLVAALATGAMLPAGDEGLSGRKMWFAEGYRLG